MNQDDVVFWVAIAVWLLSLCGAATWLLSSNAVYEQFIACGFLIRASSIFPVKKAREVGE
jgi:hypothetical protein